MKNMEERRKRMKNDRRKKKMKDERNEGNGQENPVKPLFVKKRFFPLRRELNQCIKFLRGWHNCQFHYYPVLFQSG